MAEISTRTEASAFDGTEEMPIKQGGTFKKVTMGFSARYWGLWGIQSDAGNVSACEIGLKNSGGSLITASSATASSQFDGSSVPGNAIDGSDSTIWAAASSDTRPWFTLDMGSAVTPAKLTLKSRSGSFYTQTPRVFYLGFSSDNIQFRQLGWFKLAAWTSALQIVDLNIPQSLLK